MFFIERFKSSLTGNTSYSTKPRDVKYLEKDLAETKATSFLKTVDVIIFSSYKENKGIYWYEGIRKLQPTPFKYTIPHLYFLKGTKPPRAIIRYEQVRKKVVERELF